MDGDPIIVKRQKKKNSFHVDNLLAVKTPVEVVGCDDDRRASLSDDTRPSPSITPPTLTTKAVESAFQRVYRKENSPPPHAHASPYLRESTRAFRREIEDLNFYRNSESIIVKREPITQDENYRRKPCFPPLPTIFTKYPAKIHTYRARESGSADSAGSSCNSYEYFTEGEQDRYRKYSYEREHIADTLDRRYTKELRFPYEYKRPTTDYPLYLRTSPLSPPPKKECACLDCNTNSDRSRELYNKQSWVKRPTNIIYMEPRVDYIEQKPLSKRKALLNELEIRARGRVAGDRCSDERPRVPPIKIKKEPEVEEEETETISSKKSPTEEAKIQTKVCNEEILEVSVGQSRNRAVANLLERRRVAELNCAFERLRTLIPSYGNEDRTLSKIKTLKYALTYMTHLMAILREQNLIGYFNVDRDFKKLTVQDPLIQKCREHMCVKKIF